jgi:hypothetical protein
VVVTVYGDVVVTVYGDVVVTVYGDVVVTVYGDVVVTVYGVVVVTVYGDVVVTVYGDVVVTVRILKCLSLLSSRINKGVKSTGCLLPSKHPDSEINLLGSLSGHKFTAINVMNFKVRDVVDSLLNHRRCGMNRRENYTI